MVINKILNQDALFWAYPHLYIIGIIVGAVCIIALIAITIYLLKDLGQTSMDDLPKFLWGLSFFFLPIFSWIAYHYLVRKA
ncbi:MAG: hypothetical protein EAX96_10410 [Candidatus Lokiarchaeota archaeon]|nr:hypothetical protein [Candidatus Lokiarchaeota archaeon]